LGLPPLWYLCFHYEGRWCSRYSRPAPEHIIELNYRGRQLRFPLTAGYAGTLNGVFLDDEYSVAEVLDSPPKRILDLGANIGMAAATLAAQYPEAEFVFVEPDPRNLDRLRKTIRWNGLKGTVFSSAVAAKSGRLLLRIGEDPTCSALETSQMHDLPNRVEVEACTVNELLQHVGWHAVDLVKIDIEGTEEELLTRNNHWLGRVGSLILEIHPSCSPIRIGRALGEFGLDLRRHGNGREPVFIATKSSAG
jgi:FkbM family methyltransferase